jgi:tetratricopeptide (TPR) repeat protein
MRRPICLILLAIALSVPIAHATCGGGGGGTGGMMPRSSFGDSRPEAYVVPWRVLQAGQAPLAAPLVVNWFPASADEARGAADLIGSRTLSMASTRCVGMQIVRSEDAETIAKWEVAGKQPVALLVAEAQLDAAKKKAEAGDKEGVMVKDAALRLTDPVVTAAMNARMTETMRRAFAAELAEDYEKARALYRAAAAIDPADPVPQRFLGELYRHHTGEWTLAEQTFERLLAMQPDPLSRAVALHGLGKTTIHMGDPAKGLALFEQSAAVYPLALTYRNLAVSRGTHSRRALPSSPCPARRRSARTRKSAGAASMRNDPDFVKLTAQAN